jgi:hypothetical protein
MIQPELGHPHAESVEEHEVQRVFTPPILCPTDNTRETLNHTKY